MKKLKLNAALLALVCCAGAVAPVAAGGQDDGIPVTSMSRLRGLGGDARQARAARGGPAAPSAIRS